MKSAEDRTGAAEAHQSNEELGQESNPTQMTHNEQPIGGTRPKRQVKPPTSQLMQSMEAILQALKVNLNVDTQLLCGNKDELHKLAHNI